MSGPDKSRKEARSLAAEFCETNDPSILMDLIDRMVADGSAAEYITISEVCRRYPLSRSTFDREKANPESGLAPLLQKMRGKWTVSAAEFDRWYRDRFRRR